MTRVPQGSGGSSELLHLKSDLPLGLLWEQPCTAAASPHCHAFTLQQMWPGTGQPALMEEEVPDLSLFTHCGQSVKWFKLARKHSPSTCVYVECHTGDEGFHVSYPIPQNIKKKQECPSQSCSSTVVNSIYYKFLSIETFASRSSSP